MKRRLPLTAAVATLAALGANCAGIPSCPAEGGAIWRELTSEHFRVKTDLDEPDGRELVRLLEETRAAMLATFWPQLPEIPRSVDVIAFASADRLQEHLGRPLIGGLYLLRGALPGPPVLLVSSPRDPRGRDTTRHELAHHLSRWFTPTEPIWHAEGVATFLETIAYDRTRHRVQVGKVPQGALATVWYRGRTPAEILLDAREYPRDGALAEFESSAWLLVEYLYTQRRPALRAFQRRLARLEPADFAWKAELPDLTPARLDEELRRFAGRFSYRVTELPLEVPPPEVRARLMTDPEAHGARALVFWHSQHSDNEARFAHEIKEALRQDPGAIDASTLAFYLAPDSGTFGTREDIAARATRAHPESWLAWLMAGDAAMPGSKATGESWALARDLAPEEPAPLARLAGWYAKKRRWAEALAHSSRALRQRAFEQETFRVHIEALVRSGFCADAHRFATMLIQDASPEVRADMRARWRDLGPLCAPKPLPDPVPAPTAS